jgi:hypothetical protein
VQRGRYPEDNPGWYCNKRDGGCGSQFEAADHRVTEQTPTIDTAAAADLVNTVIKMSQKRALVAAVLLATNASDLFVQDDPEDADEPPPAAQPPPDGATVRRRLQLTEAELVKEGRCQPGELFERLRQQALVEGVAAAIAGDVTRWPAELLARVPEWVAEARRAFATQA